MVYFLLMFNKITKQYSYPNSRVLHFRYFDVKHFMIMIICNLNVFVVRHIYYKINLIYMFWLSVVRVL